MKAGILSSILVLAVLGLLAMSHKIPSDFMQETQEETDKRMEWWREARFGMFIHWGIYSVPAGEWKGNKNHGEWIMHHGQIPVEEYEKFAPQFNPVKFNADEWVTIAKEAGMKYIVITSKHHDGFCLFDSEHTTYDIMDATPFKRDIMKELSEACRKQGIQICWYHSIMDWHHPDYLPRRDWEKRSAEGADLNRYVTHMKAQLKELLSNYGKIGVLWFDGEWEGTWTKEIGDDIYNYVRSLQPDIIVNNRVSKGRKGMEGSFNPLEFAGDYGTPEQQIPGKGLPYAWETCMTMNNHWGYNKNDNNWKSSEDLIRKLADIASKGGNFLLNVGPTSEGLIPQPSIDRLKTMGKWLDINGESIYGTSASCFNKLPWGRCTTKPGTLYLHVFNWPEDGQLEVPGLMNKVRKAYLLDGGKKLEISKTDRGVTINVPDEAPDNVDSVVVLKIKGKPDVKEVPIMQSADGSILLNAIDAEIHGMTARYESNPEMENIGFWTDEKDYVSWSFEVKNPGTFSAEITFACVNGSGNSKYAVSIGEQTINGTVTETGKWSDFVTKPLDGSFTLDKPGKYILSVKPVSKPGPAVMNLKAVVLRKSGD